MADLTIRFKGNPIVEMTESGTKTLKKWFIDRKVPAAQRGLVPVFADDSGVLAVYGLGQNLDCRAAEGEPAILFDIEKE